MVYKEKNKFASDKGFDYVKACLFYQKGQCPVVENNVLNSLTHTVQQFNLDYFIMLPKDKVADILSYLSCIAAILKGGDK